MRNPLAEPGLLGVSPGASLGAVIAIYYGFAGAASLATPGFGVAGAAGDYRRRDGAGPAWRHADADPGRRGGVGDRGAGIDLALNFAPNPYAAFEITTWLMGSLADRSWDHVKLLLVDEPTAGLDPRHALNAGRRLRARERAGAAVAMAIHDLGLALRFADRVVALKAGRVLAAGLMTEVLDEPLLERLYDMPARLLRERGEIAVRFLDPSEIS